MDWNELVDKGLYLYSLLGVTGVTAILTAFKIFVVDKLGNKRISKLMDFTVVASKTIGDKEKSISDLEKIFKSDSSNFIENVKTIIVDPILKKMDTVINDNIVLANLSVSLISVLNVPIDEKKQLFNALSKISSISAETVKLLSASIASQEAQQVVAVKTDNLISENISKS